MWSVGCCSSGFEPPSLREVAWQPNQPPPPPPHPPPPPPPTLASPILLRRFSEVFPPIRVEPVLQAHRWDVLRTGRGGGGGGIVIIADEKEVECGVLLNWIRAALTARSSMASPPHPPPPPPPTHTHTHTHTHTQCSPHPFYCGG